LVGFFPCQFIPKYEHYGNPKKTKNHTKYEPILRVIEDPKKLLMSARK
jgi:hypothetical protein